MSREVHGDLKSGSDGCISHPGLLGFELCPSSNILSFRNSSLIIRGDGQYKRKNPKYGDVVIKTKNCTQVYENTGYTQKNGSVSIVKTIETAPFFCVYSVYYEHSNTSYIEMLQNFVNQSTCKMLNIKICHHI